MTIDLDRVVTRVADHKPARAAPASDGVWQAATALIVSQVPGGEAAILFMERAHRPGDPWSGDISLPGGRRDRCDQDLAATARRETEEEVGIVLPEPIGRLDDVRGRTRKGIVATYVFALEQRPDVVVDPVEVASTVWIGTDTLLAPGSATRHAWTLLRFPAIRHGTYTIWGLTHRILSNFFRVVGAELPPAPWR